MENKKEPILGSDNTVYAGTGVTLDTILEGWKQGSQASYDMVKCSGCNKNVVFTIFPLECPSCGSKLDPFNR